MPELELIPPSAAPELVPKKSGKSSYNRVETLPGIDAFADRPAEQLQAQSLGPLLDWARAVIPPHQLPAVPIFLFATAGVRRMPQAKQHALMNRAREVLRDSGFRFEPSWARIIGGTDEGVYGWIAINYLRGFLDERTGAAAAAAIDAVRSSADAEAGGGATGAAGAAAVLGRRGAADSSLATQGAVTAAGTDAMAVAAAPATATVGSLDLGGSSLEMVYCAEVEPREHHRWRQHAAKSLPHLQRNQHTHQHSGAAVLEHGGSDAGVAQQQHTHGQQRGRRHVLLRRLQRLLPRGTQDAEADAEAEWTEELGGTQEQKGAEARRHLRDGAAGGALSGHHESVLQRSRSDAGSGAASALQGSASLEDGALPGREVVLGPRAYSLRTHTFQRYGLNDAFDRSVGLLLQDAMLPPPPPPLQEPKPPQPALAGSAFGEASSGSAVGQAAASGGAQQAGRGEQYGLQTNGVAARPQRPALLRQDALPPPPTAPASATTLGVDAKATPLTVGTAQSGVAVGGASAGASSSSGAVASDGSRSAMERVALPASVNATATLLQSKASADATEAAASATGLQKAQGQQQSAGEAAVEARAAQAKGALANAGSAEALPTVAPNLGARSEVAAPNTAAGLSGGGSSDTSNGGGAVSVSGGGGGGGAAARLRSRAAELEQQKRDSERIIQLVKEQLAAAQAQAGSASSTSGVASANVTGGGGNGGSASSNGTSSTSNHTGTAGVSAGSGKGLGGGSDTTAGSIAAGVATGAGGATAAAAAIDAAAATAAASAAVSRLTTGVSGGSGDAARSAGAVQRRLGDSTGAGNSGTAGAAERTRASGLGAQATGTGSLESGAAGGDASMRRRRRLAAASAADGAVGAASSDAAKSEPRHGDGAGAAHQQHRQERQDVKEAAAAAAGGGVIGGASSEEGLAVAEGLAAAAAARAAVIKAAVSASGGGADGAGVVVVGRDDADVRGGAGGGHLLLRHPCMHAGFSRPYTRTNPYGVAPEVSTVQLVGSPDWAACLALVERAVNASAHCGGGHCVLGSAQPPLQGPFVALAGFYVVWTFFGLGSAASPAAVLGAAQAHCGLPWREVESRLGQHINVEKYCLWGPYVSHLLTAGLGLSPGQFVVGSGDVGWPIGAALAEALRLPGMGPEPPLLHRLAAALLPPAWLPGGGAAGEGNPGGHVGRSAGMQHGDTAEAAEEDGWPGGLGLGVSLTVLWAVFLLVFLAWCCLYAAARSWWGRPAVISLAGMGLGVGMGLGTPGGRGSSGQLPLSARGRQTQQRVIRALWA